MTRTLVCWLMLTAIVAAQEGPRGVPDSALKEIIRRGKVEQIVSDDISDDATERLCAAMAVPALDNDKFNLTVLYGKFRNDQLDALRDDLLEPSDRLSAWVQCKNRKQGTYDVYSTEDSHLHVRFEQVPNPAQPDKWKGHDKFPTIVLQNPYSGRFGKPGTVIDFKVGYVANEADKLADWIGKGIEKFVMSSAAEPTREYLAMKNKVLGHAGHRAEQSDGPITANTAPFAVTPKVLPIGDPVPSPFPPNFAPIEPKVLTLEEIKAAAPGAPPDFLLEQLSLKVKNVADVQTAWLMRQLKDQTPKPADQTPTPSWLDGKPFLTWLIVGGGGMLILQIVLAMFGIHIPLPNLPPKQARATVTASVPSPQSSAIASQIAAEIIQGVMAGLPIRKASPSAPASPASGVQPSGG